MVVRQWVQALATIAGSDERMRRRHLIAGLAAAMSTLLATAQAAAFRLSGSNRDG
jgi:hypothetical protein